MKIELNQIKIRDLVDNYTDNDIEGVSGYHGYLDIRPKYQREFVYKDAQRDAVIDTVRKGFPLNVMYWVKNSDTAFEVLDGQQRIISICRYVTGDFSINEKYFHTLTKDEQKQILDYELTVYICEGKDSEKLAWFKTINIAGAQLTPQELRNAVYTGPWLTCAKRDFSKRGCRAQTIGDKYVRCELIRQELLELALKWISGGNIERYMADHQFDKNANELWLYFSSVIDWVELVFPTYRKEMKGLAWGEFYNEYRDVGNQLCSAETEEIIAKLMQDEDVTKKSGIYRYILSGDERYLSIRAFSQSMKREAYERQEGVCPMCGRHFNFDAMEGDHITPWHAGGKTIPENCQMLCKDCNRRKSGA